MIAHVTAVEGGAGELELRVAAWHVHRRHVGVESNPAAEPRAAAKLEDVRNAELLLDLGEPPRRGIESRNHRGPAKVHALLHGHGAVCEIDRECRAMVEEARRRPARGELGDVALRQTEFDLRLTPEPPALERFDLRQHHAVAVDRGDALAYARLRQHTERRWQGEQ